MPSPWQTDRLLPAVERAPTPTLAGLSAVAIGTPLVAALALDGAAAIGMVVAAVGVLAATSAVWRFRARLRALPLEIAPVAAAGSLDGRPAWWFRARLGLGRYARTASFEVTWRGEDGTIVVLDAISAPGPRVGAWTVVAVDRIGRVRGIGRFEVRVTAEEPGQTWATARQISHDAIRTGRFGAQVREGRIDSGSWHVIE